MLPAQRNTLAYRRGSVLSLVALFSMAALISGLLILNHTSQASLQRANIRLFQQNLEDSGRSIGYFLSERENDIRVLASSTAITGFFTNQALGMTMTYGLRASLNNVDRLFEERSRNSRLGNVAIYSHFLLLDAKGNVLSRWPRNSDAPRQDIPKALYEPDAKVQVASRTDGLIGFTCPVSQNERVLGYVRGWISYRTLVEYLLHDIPGTLTITDDRAVVFRSRSDSRLATDPIQSLIGDRAVPPAPAPDDAGNASSTLFRTTVPGYPITLTILEENGAVDRYFNRLLFMASLTLLSAVVFGAAALILRMGSKRMILETSLAEATEREKAISEKKEEMELAIEGARLGTWSWNIANGEVEFNERYWTMLGYAKGEMREHLDTWKALLHPDDAAWVVPALTAHISGATPFYATEYRMRHKSGQWIWVHDSGKILQRDREGKPLRAFGIHLDITDRKESGRLLAQAKEESDAIIRHFLDTLIVVNTDLTVIRVNQATCELLGYCEQELIGRSVVDLFHDPAAQVRAAFTFYAGGSDQPPPEETEELRNVELCYRQKDGGRLPMSFNFSLLADDDGTITGVVAGAKDVSHLRLALDQIARQKEYIETLFDIIPAGLLALSSAHEVMKSNRVFKRILEVWSGRLEMGPEECSRRLIDTIVERQGAHQTFTIQLKQGEMTAYFRCRSVFISVLEGVTSVVAIEDITEERKTEDERRLLATVVEQIGDAVFIVGTDEIVRYVNPAAVRNSGYQEAELVGSPPLIYGSDLMDQAVIAELRQTLTEGRTWHGPFRSRRKDGSIIEEDVSVSPVRNEEDGELAYFVGVKRNVTEKVNLQRQLLQAQKLEAIGQLAAGIAHEINTPMQYIQNNVTFFEQSFGDLRELLVTLGQFERAELPEAMAQRLDDLDLDFILEEIPASIRDTHDGIDRVVKIVAAMKEFSHPGTNEKVPTDLNHALENTLVVCRNEWKYDAELVTDFAGDLPLTPCFPDQLNQAILNLVINASHAIRERKESAPEAPGRITVATRQDGDWVEIRVGDNGSGIATEIRPRIYDPFFTTKPVGKGTGQGLAIVHDTIVNKHDGTIDFVTTPGEGTTFIVRLPLAAPKEEMYNEHHPPTASAGTTAAGSEPTRMSGKAAPESSTLS